LSIIIAEIGNNHCGDIETAKEMIKSAHQCGVSLVKLQAFVAKDLKGSMDPGFYKQCEFTINQYIDLIQYGEDLGIDVFYSIFSKELMGLENFQKWKKIAASQSQINPRLTESRDAYNMFISLKPGHGVLPDLPLSYLLYASDYLTETPNFKNITFLNEYYQRNVGYSDHTIGVEYCIEAMQEYECPVIEKHFTLTRDIYFKGKQFRDAVHAALPYEMERLVKHNMEVPQ